MSAIRSRRRAAGAVLRILFGLVVEKLLDERLDLVRAPVAHGHERSRPHARIVALHRLREALHELRVGLLRRRDSQAQDGLRHLLVGFGFVESRQHKADVRVLLPIQAYVRSN